MRRNQFGAKTKKSKKGNSTENSNFELNSFITIPKKEHNLNIVTNSGLLWDTKQQEAIERGNLLHLILSKVKTNKDVDLAFSDVINEGLINTEQAEALESTIHKIITHTQLKSYFETHVNAQNEKDIINPNGKILRPDRLNFLSDNTVVIIDYKTGKHQNKYINQLNEYTDVLTQMNFKITKRILVYINDEIDVKEV